MAAFVTNIVFESGYIVVHRDSGGPVRYAIADVLRALDIPTGLTYSQVAAITTLANLVVIMIRTLIERQILDESFSDSLGLDMDLDHIIAAVEAMGGTYHEPDLDDV